MPSIMIFKKNGFTLIELLIVLAIIAILSTIVLPSLSTFYNKQKEMAAAQQMFGVFKQARQEAIATRSNVSISINTPDMKIIALRKDGSVITEQKIDKKFAGYFIGTKTVSNALSSSYLFGFTSIGIPFIRQPLGPSYLLNNTQSIVGFFSSTQENININNANTSGFIIRSSGVGFLCKNTPDGQVKNKCNT